MATKTVRKGGAKGKAGTDGKRKRLAELAEHIKAHLLAALEHAAEGRAEG